MPIQRAQPDEPPAHPPTAAVLRQSQRVLHLYTEAFGGRSFELRSTDELPATERGRDRRLPSSSVHCVFLPEAIDDYPTTAENFAVFKVDILHQLGHWECGTFGFSLARWQGRQAATHTAGSEVGLAGFFERFSRPELARRLFVTFESGRIDAHLARRYRGLASDLRRVMASALADRPRVSGLPQRAALLEALVQLSLGTDLAQDSPPPIAARIEQLAQWCSQLASLEATVYTTADAVEACMALFDDLPSRTAGRTGAGASSADESEEALLAEGPPGDRAADDNAIESVAPVEFRGEFKPDLVQKELELANLIVSDENDPQGAGAPIPPEVLRELLDKGLVEITGVENAELVSSSGLSVANLPGASAEGRRRLDPDEVEDRIRHLRREIEEELGDAAKRPDAFFYDEWDYQLNGYRRAWCCLVETVLEPEDTAELREARIEQAKLFSEVRKQFELLRPDTYRRIKRLTDGEDVDLDAAVESLTDLRAGISPSEKVYTRLNRRDRDVAAAFLLDMSASTDSEVTIEKPPDELAHPEPDYVGVFDDDPFWSRGGDFIPPKRRRVIDVEKEALVLMAEALEALGDAYGVYGFSGYGRENVDFFVAKDFDDAYDDRTLGRIAAIRPKRSTRMGPSIRHAISKLAGREARVRVLLILSDGYPQDFDYGRDRTSREYGMRDTMMALREAELRGIHTYCITVDPAGHDYLREMCPEQQYLVIDDIAALPQELPKVYRGLTT